MLSRVFFRVILIAAVVCAPAQAKLAPFTLWYDAPAKDWEREALPIGNGAMGAMIFGHADRDRVQFNEKTLWTGGPGSKSGYDFGLPDAPLAQTVREVTRELEMKSR